MKITQAVILAGGAGTRLQPFTLKSPKPMVPILGKPFLAHLISLLVENGISEIVILTGYLGDNIKDYFGDGSKFNVRIKYSYTPFLDEKGAEIKSGQRLKNAYQLLNNFFLLLYCDNYWALNLGKLTKFFNERSVDALVTVYSNKDNSTKNNILVNKYGIVTKYDQKRNSNKLNGVEIGFFILNRKVLGLLSKNNSKFEDILPKLIRQKKLAGFLTDHKYYSISDPKRVQIVKKFLKPKKIIFLDRDGVICKKPPKAEYVKKWGEFKFLEGSIEAIKLLNQNGYKTYIISNQAGIARGKMTKRDLEDIHKKMLIELKKYGSKIDGIYYCPHGWDDGCECRKPKPGMLHKASKQHHINLAKTIFIGDDIRDKKAAQAAGCHPIMVNSKRNLLQIVHLLIA